MNKEEHTGGHILQSLMKWNPVVFSGSSTQLRTTDFSPCIIMHKDIVHKASEMILGWIYVWSKYRKKRSASFYMDCYIFFIWLTYSSFLSPAVRIYTILKNKTIKVSCLLSLLLTSTICKLSFSYCSELSF